MEAGFLSAVEPYALWTAIGAGGALGLYALLRSALFPLLRLRSAFRAAFAAKGEGDNEISPRDALLVTTGMMALPVVAGTATAISVGGPGAVLWLWIAAILLAGLRWLDGGLAFRYGSGGACAGRRRNGGSREERRGALGTVHALLGRRWPAAASVYAFVGLGAASLAGAALAGRTVAAAANDAGWPGAWLALGLGAVGLVVAFAGAARAAAVARIATSLALAAILVASVAAVVAHPERIPNAFVRIFSEGRTGAAPSGAFVGAFLMEAIRAGLALGIAPTAAAFGPASTVQAAARHGNARRAALAASLEPLLSVLGLSLLVALPILTSRAWNTAGETSYPLRETVTLTHVAASAAEAKDPDRLFRYLTRFRNGKTLDRVHFLGGRGMLEEVRLTNRGEPLDAALEFEDGHLVKMLVPRDRAPPGQEKRRSAGPTRGASLGEVPLSEAAGIVVHGTGLRRGARLVATAFEDGLPKKWGGTVVALATLLFAIAALVGWTLFSRRVSGAVAEPPVARILTAAAGASAALGAVRVVPWLVPAALALTALLALPHVAALFLGSAESGDLTGRGGER